MLRKALVKKVVFPLQELNQLYFKAVGTAIIKVVVEKRNRTKDSFRLRTCGEPKRKA